MRICAVKDCHNGTYKLGVWKSRECEKHACKFGDEACDCPQPFKLHTFPSKKSRRPEDEVRRLAWRKMINRKAVVGGKTTDKLWDPKEDDRVCSVHFVDGRPTAENPNPTLKLGYTLTKVS